MVLLKAYDARGFTFFTNYDSRKGTELAANPRAAMAFLWHEFERQVRVEGATERISEAESDAYFHSRPLGSRVGAWASNQSSVIAGRAVIELAQSNLEAMYAGGDVPRPPHWGGVRVVPRVIEFWQGRPSRLHDRVRFRRVEGSWARDRLSP